MSKRTDEREPSNINVYYKARNFCVEMLVATANEKKFRPDLKRKKNKKENVHQVDGTIVETVNAMATKNGGNFSVEEVEEIYLKAYSLNLNENRKENIYLSMIDDLRRDVKTIFREAWGSNIIRVTDKETWSLRSEKELRAISACGDMLTDISLAYKLCHIPTKRIKYWAKKAMEIRDELKAVHAANKKRYAEFE